MMIDKEVYRGMSPRDSLIMKMAKNEIEIDEVIEAREFLDALEKARENGYKGVDYAKLTGLLIEAVKEQQKQIDELKSRLG